MAAPLMFGEEVEIRFHGLYCFVLGKILASFLPFLMGQTSDLDQVNVLFAVESTLASQSWYSLTNDYLKASRLL